MLTLLPRSENPRAVKMIIPHDRIIWAHVAVLQYLLRVSTSTQQFRWPLSQALFIAFVYMTGAWLRYAGAGKDDLAAAGFL